MSYSQYGGVAFRGGIRVPNASDAVLTPELVNLGTPGVYPGFVDAIDALGKAAFEGERARSISAHVVLGDGPLIIALHKQVTMAVHLLVGDAFSEVDLCQFGVDLPEGTVADDDGHLSLDTYQVERKGLTLRFEVAGNAIEYRIIRSVQHVRLTQPDGTVWSGFSGSEIGAGHDDEETAPFIRQHLKLFES